MHSSAPRLRGFTPPRRSGITHLTTPHYATGPAATLHGGTARPLLSAAAPLATTASIAAASSAVPTPGGAAAAAVDAPAQLRHPSASPPRHEGAPREAPHAHHSVDCASWRHPVSAVCRRLERTMRETEQVLMRVAGSTPRTAQRTAPTHDAATGCSPAQLLDALQRYRRVCMAALLELEAVQQRHFSAPPLRDSAAATRDGSSDGRDEVDGPPPPPRSPSRAVEVAQLQRRYHVMESRLATTLAAQAAYMDEITLQQHQREREGVMGEYLWTARLLVEQEDAERGHLHTLWHYLAAGAASWQRRRQAAELSAEEEAASVEPLPPPPMKSAAGTLAATRASLTSSPRFRFHGHGDAAVERLAAHNAHLTRELAHARQRTHALLQEQQQDLQAAQERSLAQLVARHCAETAELEQRALQAEARVRSAQRDATGTSATAAAPRGADDGVQGSLQQQLKETTKRMWQLHLVNDHLDAKVRVLEREVEELRDGRSPLRGGGRQRNEHVADAAHAKEPPPPRIAAGASASSSRSARPAVQPVARHLSSSFGEGRHGTPHVDVRYGQPLAPAAAGAAESSRRTSSDGITGSNSGDGGGGAAQSVSPGVWVGYDERSTYLATTATPVKQRSLHQQPQQQQQQQQCLYGPSHSSSLSSVHSMRWADEALSSSQQQPQQQQQRLHATRTSQQPQQQQRSFTRTLSPVRQLSLDRTPAPLPPRTAATTHVEAAVAADDGRSGYGEDGETDNDFDGTAVPVRAQTVSEGAAAHCSAPIHPDYDDAAAAPLTAPHDAMNAGSDTGDASSSSQAGGGGGGLDEDAAATATASSTASSFTSSTATAPRARLEAVRRDIVRHAERLELEVQAVTSRHDAARRQRRRERDTLRVNLSVHSAKSSPAPSMSREDPDSAAAVRHHAPQSSADAADDNDEESEALNRALEELHIEQQEEDDALEQYYDDVNQKRAELERCLRVVEEKLAALA